MVSVLVRQGYSVTNMVRGGCAAGVVEAEDRARLWMGFWEVGESHMRGTQPPRLSLSWFQNPPHQNSTGAQTAAQNPGVQATTGIRGKTGSVTT